MRNLYCGVNVGLKFTHTRPWRVGAWSQRIPGLKGESRSRTSSVRIVQCEIGTHMVGHLALRREEGKVFPMSEMALFEERQVRRVFHHEVWWYVLTDIVSALTDSP